MRTTNDDYGARFSAAERGRAPRERHWADDDAY
jgi:hypothetical protein